MVGGQAVLEGVMMRGPGNWAVAVRTPSGEIAQVSKPIDSAMARHRVFRLPVVSGVESVLVSEDDLGDAFRWLYARTKLACELGAAASTAALLSGKVRVEPGELVVAVVSGGNIAAKQAAAILAI